MLARQRVKLDEFLPHVMAMVQGDASRAALPPEVALSYIKNSAIEFARKSGILTRQIEVKFEDGVDIYPILDPACERLHTLISAWDAKTGCPLDVEAWEDNCVRICKLPGPCDEHFIVKIIASPSRNCCEVDAVLYEDWHDYIVAGALSALHMMPQSTWTSSAAAQMQGNKFNEGVKEARVKIAMSGTIKNPITGPNHDYIRANVDIDGYGGTSMRRAFWRQ